MNTAGKNIVLLVPGLEGPHSDHPVADYLEQRPGSLDRLISRSHPVPFPGAGVDDLLLHYFGLDNDAPVAPLTFVADTGAMPAGYVMRADPVHLRADQSSLRLFETHGFALSQDEADALASAFNEYYSLHAGRGWRLKAPVPHRWYLELDTQPDVSTTPVADVAGKDINLSLPQGGAARDWHAMLNEVQMLFHDHAVNRVREQRGQPAINSLWPWGGGMLPQTPLVTDIDRVVTNNPLAVALAGMAGVEVQDVAENAGQILSLERDGIILVVLDSLRWPAIYNEVEIWIEAIRMLDEKLIAPLLDALAGGAVNTLKIHPCNGTCFTLSRSGLRRFWRRVLPYEQALS